MTTAATSSITVQTTVNAPVHKVWNYWTEPKHIVQWNYANNDWLCPSAENDLKAGGRFLWRMEAKDGSFGFDFSGEYITVAPQQTLVYRLNDGRNVTINFEPKDSTTTVTETFEPETENDIELQQQGWQAILENFKNYVELPTSKEKLHFEIFINAPAEKVYNTMIDSDTYQKWTAVFNPMSHFEGSWENGAKILFIGTDEKGTRGGMVARIRENTPYRFISIQHIGLVNGDQEITEGPEVADWAGALEEYTFTPQNGGTLLMIEVDVNDDFKTFFAETWPKSLQTLKELCEA